MIDKVILFLPIEPKPLSRARHAKRGSFISTYYDKKSIEQMDYLKNAILNALKEEDIEVINKHKQVDNTRLKIALKLEFGFSFPKSYSKKKRSELLYQAHTVKPDIDNLIKNVLDRGNGILWDDDKYIYKIESQKRYDYNYIKIEVTYESTQKGAFLLNYKHNKKYNKKYNKKC